MKAMENRQTPEIDSTRRSAPGRPAARLDRASGDCGLAAGESRRPPQHLAWALATAAAVALGVASLLMVRTASPPQASQQAGTVLVNPTLTEGQVLIWLDENTSLHMTYATPDTAALVGRPCRLGENPDDRRPGLARPVEVGARRENRPAS
jgi:hypothetical protein